MQEYASLDGTVGTDTVAIRETQEAAIEAHGDASFALSALRHAVQELRDDIVAKYVRLSQNSEARAEKEVHSSSI